MSTSAEPDRLPDLVAIRAAGRRIADLVGPTPLVRANDLEAVVGQPLWLKAENLQRTGSFKARGALNWVLTAVAEELEPGLVTVSAGNHAVALAWAAAQRHVPVTVVMPEGSSNVKIRTTRDFGAEVIVRGDINEAVDHCSQLARDRGFTLVHPYNDPRVMAGQGTVGLELLGQAPPGARILCPVGGGGLISGVGLALKGAAFDASLIGVEPRGAATMRNAWDRADPKARLARVDTIAASLAPAVVGDLTYAASRKVVDDIVTVSDRAIRKATALMLSRGHLYAEPGACVAIAALLDAEVESDPQRPSVAVITGGNMDFSQLIDIVSSEAA